MPYIGAGVAAVLVVTLAVSLVAARSGHSRLQAWENFMLARSADDLERVIAQYEDTDVALWAELELADYLCASAQSKLLTDRDTAAKELRQAIKHYQRVLNSPKATPIMRQRAALPEAKCWEILGERRKALERYQQIARQFAGTPIAEEANQLRQQLASSDAADFYKWFAQYKPPKLPESAASKAGSAKQQPPPPLPPEKPQTKAEPAQQPAEIPELPPETEQTAEEQSAGKKAGRQAPKQKPAADQPKAKQEAAGKEPKKDQPHAK